VTAAIVGGRSAKQAQETAAALEFRLTQEEYERIVAFLGTMQ
jgi:aryl-alcohol dehydrogenase-like predicted oxidoreductase